MVFHYLVQHAQAKTKEEDPNRGLTEEGLENAQKVADYLAGLRLELGSIFHSGKERARETAEILAEKLGLKGNIFEKDGLAPMDDPHIWAERLSQFQESVMLVGHLPHLSRLASLLLVGEISRPVVSFKNAGVVCLKRESADWSLEWIIIPGIVK